MGTPQLRSLQDQMAETCMPCAEGAGTNGNADKAPNGCGWKRGSGGEKPDEREKALYNAGTFSADTQYCHHFNAAGQHLVLNGLPSSEARHCCGVIYFSVGFSGKSLTCGEQRRPKKDGESAGHDACTPERCPFLAEGKECPYTKLNAK